METATTAQPQDGDAKVWTLKDGSTILLVWSVSLKRWVAIPEDEN